MIFKNPIKFQKLTKNIKDIKFLTQKIVSIYSAKGGVGRTSIAIHLAKYLEKQNPLLLDLNFSQGPSDISFYLDLPKLPHLSNFMMDIENPERAFENSIIKPKGYKFDVIQSPPTLRQSDNFSISTLITLIEVAKSKYGIIIFDLPHIFTDLVFHVLNTSTDLLLITVSEPGSDARLREIIDILYSNPNITVCLNKYKKSSFYKPKDLENYIEKNVVTIGYDNELLERMINGVIRVDSSSVFGEGIISLVKKSLLK